MQHKIVNVATVFVLLLVLLGVTAFGQVTAPLSGTVTDPNGAVVPGATVTVKNTATGAEFRAATAGNGTYTVPSLGPGTYNVAISATGFKSINVEGVKIDTGVPATTNVTLELGAASETVVVQGGGEVVQSQTANISTTLSVNQIANLPLVSRNPLNFVTLMAGVNTPGQNRNSTINGLPTSAIDITLDGINIQDNFNKSTDGFFTRVAPSLDSVEEVTVSTATPEAQGGGLGAVQIKFVSRQGSNNLHGSLYEYHRNPWLNSNYWFNNRDLPADPRTGKAPRDRVLFNQYGFRVGGPIWLPKIFNGRNRAFFFVNYEESRQPSQVSRQRTILNPLTQSGVFQYNVSGQVRTVNLLTLAAGNNCAPQGATPVPCTSTIDPTIGKLLGDIRSATAATGGITQLTDPNLQRFSYNPTGFSINKRPTVRFDVNVTDKHHVETSWSYLDGRGGPDFLNNVEPQFPGFPNQGSQPADRYTGSVALRSTLSSSLVNELRAGLSGGPSRFNPTASAADFSQSVANQAGFAFGTAGSTGGFFAAAGISNPTATSAPSRRNPLYRTVSDTVNWTRGAHGFSLGGQLSWVTLTFNAQTLVPSLNFGVDTSDPANAMFTTANFQGANTTDINNAKAIYAILTGRITAINGNARLVEKTGKYVYLGNAFERSRQKELGLFAQDTWRMRPNLTLNYGLRWELQGSFYPLNSSYTYASINDAWGVSGPGNLFKPALSSSTTLPGRVTQFNQFKAGDQSYNTDYKNFAPSFGLAWSPNAKSGWLKRLVGEGGQTVVRGGYSLAYSRRGIGEFRGIISANPGITITTNRDIATGNLGALPLLLRETSRLGAPTFNDTPVYPLTGAVTNSANTFDPNLKVPYTQSWSFGIQREITRSMAVEVRYVGNRFLRGWTTYNLNAVENNIAENGLLNEFKLAQRNLQAFIAANPTCGQPNQPACSFAYRGLPGQSPLPIILAYFQGLPAAQAGIATNYTSTNFTSSTFVNTLALNNPNICNSTGTGACQASSFAANLDASATFRTNAGRAGLGANFMLTNPDLRGGANFTGNGGYTRYDGLQIDLRRRLSKGLLVQANYQFAKAFSSQRVSFRAPRINALDTNTLRHAFKVNWVYGLPFGRGQAFFGKTSRLMDSLVGGWEFDGSARIQSGQLFDLAASNSGNLSLVGMTMKELRDAYKLRFDDAKKVVYILPQDIIDNTIKAFGTSATAATGYGASGAPTGRYLAPASNANCLQVYNGQCAPQNLFVTGPKFTRWDLSVVKRVKFTERYNFELRGEFLNAFNNINFFNPTGNAFINPSSQTFGQVTTAYTDSSNTQDPGGRLVQLVARFNF
ncbi:MAG: carboxypeptidase regulatory-like domain-containing protein [Acidobacteria bacterium]|nr:carboxypeptidase regulatory-like domain-containing protein [Acidobacteriota bacterium]MBI3421946.1 carboxypeptidase regulatory-like domain-containing protein [Acidobacteriota bacterium]